MRSQFTIQPKNNKRGLHQYCITFHAHKSVNRAITYCLAQLYLKLLNRYECSYQEQFIDSSNYKQVFICDELNAVTRILWLIRSI
jgi:hypothetical protein